MNTGSPNGINVDFTDEKGKLTRAVGIYINLGTEEQQIIMHSRLAIADKTADVVVNIGGEEKEFTFEEFKEKLGF